MWLKCIQLQGKQQNKNQERKKKRTKNKQTNKTNNTQISIAFNQCCQCWYHASVTEEEPMLSKLHKEVVWESVCWKAVTSVSVDNAVCNDI